VTKEGICHILRTHLTFRKGTMAKENRVTNETLWDEVDVALPV
jgi:hypothetical protein